MDAVKRTLRVLSVLLLGRPVITGLVILVCGLVTTLMYAFREVGNLAFGIGLALMLGAIVAFIMALATQRASWICNEASLLGVPHHQQAVRSAQWILLISSLGLPSVLIVVFDGGMPGIAAFAGLAAAGASMLLFPAWFFPVIFSLWLAHTLGFEPSSWIEARSGQTIALLFSAYVFYRWLQICSARPQWLRTTAAPFAGASREIAATTEHQRDTQQSATLEIDTPGFIDSRSLWFGMNHDPSVRWRSVAAFALLCWAAFVCWHFFRGDRPEPLAYGLATLTAAWIAFLRIGYLSGAWRDSIAEQPVLRLLPQWPSGARFKRLVLTSAFRTLTGVVIAWIAALLPALALGWINVEIATRLSGVLAIAMLSCVGAFLGTLPRRRQKDVSLLTLWCLLSAVLAAPVVLLAPAWIVLIAAAIALTPASVGAAGFALRPLTFPAELYARRTG